MKNIIVGTAGHIDHGKTALVGALTGIDTDRLAEEKRRGISIDLGFAHLDLGVVRLGFVDVPGHERFVKNMLAGAAGIDLVLLAIAADESIMPQTREHFEICRLLGIRHGIVALTKADLVDPDMLELVRLEASDLLAGTLLEAAPIIAVSSRTGAGLAELRSTLLDVAARVEPHRAGGAFRLPIDRAFSLRGFGTVVTGTLSAGTLNVEDEVEVYPLARRLRVRGLEVHSAAVRQASAGQRVAVNLAAVDAAGVAARHDARAAGLVQPHHGHRLPFRAAPLRRPAEAACPAALPLRHRRRRGRGAAARGPCRRRAGTSAWLRLLLGEPLLLLPGDRFIARMFSPLATLGGGVVIDNQPPPRLRKAAVVERLPVLAAAPLAGRLRLFALESGLGARVADLVRRSGATPAEVLAAAPEAGLDLLRDPEPRLLPHSVLVAQAQALAATLERFHTENPLLAGMPRSAAAMPPFLLDAILAASADVVAEGELLRLASRRPQLRAEEDEAASIMEGLFRAAGLSVPAVADVLARSGLDAARSRTLLQLLLRQGRLVKVSAELICHRDSIAALKARLAEERGRLFGVAEFKLWTGVSRKYAIPLLEFLDRERVTRRQGDERQVL